MNKIFVLLKARLHVTFLRHAELIARFTDTFSILQFCHSLLPWRGWGQQTD